MSVLNHSQQTLSDRITLIRLGSMLDNNNADSVAQSITEALAGGAKFVIIDFNDLEFISSAGVGAIIGTIESFRELGGDIVLCNVSETTSHVMRVLDLLDFLTIAGTQEQAMTLCTQSYPEV